ncbi:MAG: hypothetical protein QOK43_2197 [Acidimicrobiaceae bacterium]|nr:hypothetical protein [Acidimicrobiaceae bacterium]
MSLPNRREASWLDECAKHAAEYLRSLPPSALSPAAQVLILDAVDWGRPTLQGQRPTGLPARSAGGVREPSQAPLMHVVSSELL